MGQAIIHVGPVGDGSALKMLVNSMLAQAMAAFAECLVLGRTLALGRDFLLNTLANLPVAAPFLQAKAQLIHTDNFHPHFPLELMYKDLQLLSRTAYEHNQPIPLAALTKELHAQANHRGLGREDFTAVYLLFNDIWTLKKKEKK